MALKRNERYPGRFGNPNAAHPQGAFKNRTSPTSQDGSYLDSDWGNDWDGFFARLLTVASVTPNGNVDTGTSSQYYDAMIASVKKDVTNRYEERPGETVIFSDNNKDKYLTSRTDNSWGYYNATVNRFIPLAVSAGGTGVSSLPDLSTALGLKSGAFGEVRVGNVSGTGNKSFSSPFPQGQVRGIAFCPVSSFNYMYSVNLSSVTGSGFSFNPKYFAGGSGAILPADGEAFYYIAWGM